MLSSTRALTAPVGRVTDTYTLRSVLVPDFSSSLVARHVLRGRDTPVTHTPAGCFCIVPSVFFQCSLLPPVPFPDSSTCQGFEKRELSSRHSLTHSIHIYTTPVPSVPERDADKEKVTG